MKIAKLYPLPALLLVLGGCGSSNGPGAPSATSKVTMKGSCPTNSSFVGDGQCLAPPAATEGFQLHYGPSDYDDPAEIAKFTLIPGAETNDCFFLKSPNTTDAYYSGFDFQMRPGSHHLIAQSRNSPGQQATPPIATQGFNVCAATDGVPEGLFGTTQTPKLDYRTDPAPENAGLARLVPADTQAVINFHVINETEATALKEAWLNYYYIDLGGVKGMRGAVDLNGGLGYNIAPATHKTYRFSCSPTANVRILQLGSHMHSHALRMTVYKVPGGATATPQKPVKLLEGYSWEEPTQLSYDTAHTIKPADPVSKTEGGDYSGDLYLTPSDAIQWECEVNNTSNVNLTFRNEVTTGEMCLVAGTVVNSDDPMTLTNFACDRD
jgi:hypothetical protein